MFCFCFLLRAPIDNSICLLALLTRLPSKLNKDFTTTTVYRQTNLLIKGEPLGGKGLNGPICPKSLS